MTSVCKMPLDVAGEVDIRLSSPKVELEVHRDTSD